MRTLFLSTLIVLAACSSKPAPLWQATAHTQLTNYIESYLSGDDRFAAAHFEKALDEIRKTGDPVLMGRALLTRCALETASLAGDECAVDPAFRTDPENAAYYAFVSGHPHSSPALPKRYRAVAAAIEKRDAAATHDAIADMEDAVSRLVAVGVAVRHGIEDTAIFEAGAATASANGWERPLAAYLSRLRTLYETAKDPVGTASVEARIKTLETNKKSK